MADLSWLDNISLEDGPIVLDVREGVYIRDGGCSCCSTAYVAFESLSAEERQKIADHMIGLWGKFKKEQVSDGKIVGA